jgi:hypothetical protein
VEAVRKIAMAMEKGSATGWGTPRGLGSPANSGRSAMDWGSRWGWGLERSEQEHR